jgi:hypothetical protein
MTDLRTDAAGMAELLSHLREREGAVNHFYCDHRGLVTIAVGFLVDRSDGADTVGKQLARTLCARDDVGFASATGAAATTAEVEADWQRVKDHGRAHPGIGARHYGPVARLRIDTASVDAITRTIVTRFLDDLYQKRPFVLEHDVHVAIALLDARYNPAGVRIYGDDPRVTALWHALDPQHADFDTDRAPALFAQIWDGRGNDRYQGRHAQRVAWMRAGLAPAQPAATTSTLGVTHDP